MEGLIVVFALIVMVVVISMIAVLSDKNKHRQMVDDSAAVITQFMTKAQTNINRYFDGDEIWCKYSRAELMFLAIVVYVDVVMNNNKNHKYDDLVRQVVDEWITVILSVMQMPNDKSNRRAIRDNINRRGRLYQPILNRAVELSKLEIVHVQAASMEMLNNHKSYYGIDLMGHQLSNAGLYETFLTTMYDILEALSLDFSIESAEDIMFQALEKPKIDNLLPKIRRDISLCQNPDLDETEVELCRELGETFRSRHMSLSILVSTLAKDVAKLCLRYQTQI